MKIEAAARRDDEETLANLLSDGQMDVANGFFIDMVSGQLLIIENEDTRTFQLSVEMQSADFVRLILTAK